MTTPNEPTSSAQAEADAAAAEREARAAQRDAEQQQDDAPRAATNPAARRVDGPDESGNSQTAA